MQLDANACERNRPLGTRAPTEIGAPRAFLANSTGALGADLGRRRALGLVVITPCSRRMHAEVIPEWVCSPSTFVLLATGCCALRSNGDDVDMGS